MAIVTPFPRGIPRLLAGLCLLFALQWSLVTPLAAEESGAAADFARYQAALAQLDRDRQAGRRAQAALAALRASADPFAPLYLGLAQVQWLLRPGGVEDARAEAQQVLDQTTAAIADQAQLPVALRLELARTEVAVGRVAPALARLDAIGRDHEGLPRVHAAAGAAAVYRQQRRYDDALRWIDFALRSLGHHDRYAEHGELRRRLRREREALERLRDLLVHGPGFVLYREARVAQLADQHEQALQRWDQLLEVASRNTGNEGVLDRFRADPEADATLLEQLPVPAIYQEAARFYRHYALAALGRHQQAQTSLRRFIAEDPTGLYRCEARRLQGDLAFEFQHDPRAAARYYDEALQAIAAARSLDAQLEHFAVPPDSRQRTAPPARMRGLQGWGNIRWSPTF